MRIARGTTQCFNNCLFKNPFTIYKIPFFPQNFLATQTVEKSRKFRHANLRQMYHRPYEKSSFVTLPENLGKVSSRSLHECICSTYMFMFIQGRKVLDNGGGVEWQKALNGKF
jgi:hypothetical protein